MIARPDRRAARRMVSEKCVVWRRPVASRLFRMLVRVVNTVSTTSVSIAFPVHPVVRWDTRVSATGSAQEVFLQVWS